MPVKRQIGLIVNKQSIKGGLRNNECVLLLGLELVTMADPPKSQLVGEGFF